MALTLEEHCAAAAAVSLHLVDVAPPISWMGGKRRYAPQILEVLGWPHDGSSWARPARLVWIEAGTWGWVWPVLLGLRGLEVCTLLEQWEREYVSAAAGPYQGARRLWNDLAARPPDEDLVERTAQWLWLQARAASGAPIWWDGTRWTQGSANGRPPQPAGQRGNWHGCWRMGRAATDQSDRLATQKGRNATRSGGIVHPATIGKRIRAIRTALHDVEVVVHNTDVRDASLTAGAYRYFDPPYAGATRYEEDLDREAVLTHACRLPTGASAVAVSEAEALSLPGWSHRRLETTKNAKTQEWVTYRRAEP